jgi:hypothetical protein
MKQEPTEKRNDDVALALTLIRAAEGKHWPDLITPSYEGLREVSFPKHRAESSFRLAANSLQVTTEYRNQTMAAIFW